MKSRYTNHGSAKVISFLFLLAVLMLAVSCTKTKEVIFEVTVEVTPTSDFTREQVLALVQQWPVSGSRFPNVGLLVATIHLEVDEKNDRCARTNWSATIQAPGRWVVSATVTCTEHDQRAYFEYLFIEDGPKLLPTSELAGAFPPR